MVIGELINKGAEKLSAVENPLREARLLLSVAMEMSVSDIIVYSDKPVSDTTAKKYFEFISKRASGMPFAYITNKQEFYGISFYVDENVLIPRADTETLVDLIVSFEAGKVLDLCTGSGCIAVAAAKTRPDFDITAADISRKALEIAKKNATANGCTNIKFLKLDVLSEVPDEKYDIIVSNPPYIEKDELETLMKDVIDFEPRLALDGGDDGLVFYRRICSVAPEILNPDGRIAFEIGHLQYDKVFECMQENFKDIGFKADLSGIKRVIFGTLK